MAEEKRKDELFELVEGISVQLQDVNSKIQSMDSKIQSMDSKIQDMDIEMKRMNGVLERHDTDIRDIKLTLENVINRNISIIAENHIELNRKLDESLRMREEDEKLYLRMNIVENDIRRIKERVGIE